MADRRSRRSRFKDAHRPGEPAQRVGSWEEIGPPDCPIMYRRTLFSSRWLKLLWHEFMPNASDEAAHDHPRSFLTIVLRGEYLDLTPCSACGGDGKGGDYLGSTCEDCWGSGWDVPDRVAAPTIRFRRAEHAHITKVGPKGATTFVVMGPLRREWGFFRDGRWYAWRQFERLFGLNWRCP